MKKDDRVKFIKGQFEGKEGTVLDTYGAGIIIVQLDDDFGMPVVSMISTLKTIPNECIKKDEENMKNKIIINFINTLEDVYFYKSERSVQLKLNSDNTEIHIVGKDNDDSDEVLEIIPISDNIKIDLNNRYLYINSNWLFYDI